MAHKYAEAFAAVAEAAKHSNAPWADLEFEFQGQRWPITSEAHMYLVMAMGRKIHLKTPMVDTGQTTYERIGNQ